jgi:FdhE protein
MASTDLETLTSKAKYLKTRWPIYEEMIDWLVDLLSEAYGAQERVCLPQTSWNRARLSQRFQAGKPLFERRTIPVDMRITRDLYTTLVSKTERRRGKLEGLRSMLSGSFDEARVVLRAVLASESETLESLCSKHGTDASLVSLLMRLALWPSLRQLSRRAEAEIDLADWSSGQCPVCGSWPGLAELGEGDKPRSLYCSLCETPWPFPRFKCPFCGNDQPGSLSYVYAEEEKDLRVDLCERCGQGIRTLDARHHAAPVIPILDELVISHLAMAANGGNPKALS